MTVTAGDQSNATLVSVVIPAFDAAAYIGEAIESVLAQAVPMELIVVDDGSTDATCDVIATFGDRVRCLRQEHQGASAARNLGVRTSRGMRLAFLDADDLWPADKLPRQSHFLDTHTDVDVVFGHAHEFYSADLTQSERARLPLRDAMPAYVPGSMLIRRAAFERVGEFSTAWRVGEFVDWWARAREAGLNAEMQSELALLRRVHQGNSGRRAAGSQLDYVRILKRSIDRRRSLSPDPSSQQ
jgi:glycosyltransferase involved in cell wall biosynthesis